MHDGPERDLKPTRIVRSLTRIRHVFTQVLSFHIPLCLGIFITVFNLPAHQTASKTDKTKLIIFYLFMTLLCFEIFSTSITFLYVFTVFLFYTPDWLNFDFSINVQQIFIIATHVCHYVCSRTNNAFECNPSPFLAGIT